MCIVVLGGTVDISSAHGEWLSVGSRPDPFSGLPEAAYLPPGTEFSVSGASEDAAEVALCFAPARSGATARLLPGSAIEPETRGSGPSERVVHPILMGRPTRGRVAARLEVLTPAGHWSSYPPHKHDRDDAPGRDLPGGDLLPPDRPCAGVRPAACVHRRPQRSTRRSRSATATACSCRAATTRSRRRRGYRLVLPQCDGRPDAPWVCRQRSRPRMDVDGIAAVALTLTRST